MMPRALVMVALLSYTICVSADDVDSVIQRWGVEMAVTPGKALVMDEYQRKWQKGKRNFAIDVGFVKVSLPCDSDAFAYDYGYPVLGIGLSYSLNHDVTMHRSAVDDWGLAQEVGYDSRMGDVISLYGSFDRSFFRTRRWSASYVLNFGVAYSRLKYNTYNNIDNELIGSRWLIHFGGSLYAKYHFARDWGIKAGVDYYHYSNGALNRPNKGANFVGPVLGIVYEPYYGEITRNGSYIPDEFHPYYYVNIVAAFGGKTLDEDWKKTQFNTEIGEPDYRTSDFHFYTAWSVRSAIMYRYARRWASGVGADIFYGNYAHHVEYLDEAAGRYLKHSPVSVGLSAHHEAFYKRFSLAMSIGCYLYRHMGYGAKHIETPYYEHIGLRYAFPAVGGMQVGVDVKAHRTKADLTEVVLVVPVSL